MEDRVLRGKVTNVEPIHGRLTYVELDVPEVSGSISVPLYSFVLGDLIGGDAIFRSRLIGIFFQQRLEQEFEVFGERIWCFYVDLPLAEARRAVFDSRNPYVRRHIPQSREGISANRGGFSYFTCMTTRQSDVLDRLLSRGQNPVAHPSNVGLDFFYQY